MNSVNLRRKHTSIVTSDVAGALSRLRARAQQRRVNIAGAGLGLMVATVVVMTAVMRTHQVTLIAAARNLTSDHIITATDLIVRKLPVSAAPAHSVMHASHLIGRRLVGPIAQGDAFSDERVARLPRNASQLLHITLTVDPVMSRTLAPGDTVDIWNAVRPMDYGVATQPVLTAKSVRVVSATSGHEGTASVTVAVPSEFVPALVAAQSQGAATVLTRRPGLE